VLNSRNVTETKIWKEFFKNHIQMENKHNKTQFLLDATGEQNTKQKLLEQERKYCNSSSAENEKGYEGVAQYK
jgi:hypothetical protein